MAEPMEIDQSSRSLSLDVLHLINESRMTYGLRSQDYQRYREYCANRVRRLRQILKLSQANSKKTNVQKPLPDVIKDVRYLHLFVYETERAWAYAMELKQESANSMDTRYHYHLVKRLKRAAQYAQQLVDLCQQQTVDARTILDGKAYAGLMKGYLYFEQQDWQKALNQFIQARFIYEQFVETNSNAEQEALCYSAMDEIDPNIRFCAYKLQISDGQDAESIAKQHRGKEVDALEAELAKIAQTDKKKNKSAQMMTWRDKSFSVKNESLAEAVQKAQTVRSNADGKSELESSLFNEILNAWVDAEKLAKKVLKENKQATAKVSSSKSVKATEDLNQLFTFIEYNLYGTTIERDFCAVKKIEKNGRPQEAIRLYNDILKNAEYISELPQVKDDISLEGELQTMTLYYKACRCVQVALVYSNMSTKTAESLALYQKAQTYIVQAKKSLSDIRSFNKDAILKVSEQDLTRLEETIRAGTWKARAAWYLEHGEIDGSNNAIDGDSCLANKMQGLDINEEVLIDHLDTYPSRIAKDSLVNFPPKLQPVACKPFYFDLAANFVQYPEQALRDRTKSSSSGGFWGLFSRK